MKKNGILFIFKLKDVIFENIYVAKNQYKNPTGFRFTTLVT